MKPIEAIFDKDGVSEDVKLSEVLFIVRGLDLIRCIGFWPGTGH